ncbi:MAG: UDP-2,3-diacylglucosamine diphosphatase [Saprospiraceae bacterium]|nr:UDP-2,3-diacylglucosamine diphosphatase [Saprospiraceae bacterium]
MAVISDVHLGTFGCHAQELLNYLRSIQPEILIINGDFIDGWQFRRNYFPAQHIQVIYEIMRKAMEGTRVYYLAGNHDEFIRKFIPFFSGNIYFRDQLELELNGKKYLFFHGDVFDFSIQLSPLLAKLGGFGYDHLIRFNTMINKLRTRFGMARISFAHNVKCKIKKAIKFIQSFEEEAIAFAKSRKVDYVVCGHIHIPCIREVVEESYQLTYMNSGDWIENLTVLEYQDLNWSLYTYDETDFEFLNKKIVIKEKPAKAFHEVLQEQLLDLNIYEKAH